MISDEIWSLKEEPYSFLISKFYQFAIRINYTFESEFELDIRKGIFIQKLKANNQGKVPTTVDIEKLSETFLMTEKELQQMHIHRTESATSI